MVRRKRNFVGQLVASFTDHSAQVDPRRIDLHRLLMCSATDKSSSVLNGQRSEEFSVCRRLAMPYTCTPPREQRAIAAFLDRETARIDVLVAKVREAIHRLKELRTALISAAVTGKIDVREEVA